MVQRHINLSKILGKNRSTFLFGPRGCGKTALLREFFDGGVNGEIISLLNSENFRRYKLYPEQFRKDLEGQIKQAAMLTIAVDEIQKVPQLLDEVHYLIEEHKSSIRFILTGSSARTLKRGDANLLAGRALTTKLHPLTPLEIELDLDRALTIGTLPGIYLDEGDVLPVLNAYVDTYVREEILQEAIIRKTEPFLRFLEVAAQLNGEPLNYSAIARQAAVSPHTVESYFQILVDTMLGRLIPAFDLSIRRQLTQSAKFYFFDCGVLNQLRGELRSELKPTGYRFGKLFENFLINMLLAGNDYLECGYRPSHWRTASNLEVDLILSAGTSKPVHAIEIKSDSEPREQDTSHLLSFADEHPQAKLWLVCRTPRRYRIGKVEVLPWQDAINSILKVML